MRNLNSLVKKNRVIKVRSFSLFEFYYFKYGTRAHQQNLKNKIK